MTERVPERAQALQTCYFWYQTRELDARFRSFVRGDQMLVVTCPESCPDLIRRFRENGGIVLLYVSIYKAPCIREVPDDLRKWEGGSPCRSSLMASPYWTELDLESHPEWILRTTAGQARRPFDLDYYMPGWYQVSPLAPGYSEAVLRGIRAVARDGRFNGVFLDNLHPLAQPSALQTPDGLVALDMERHAAEFYGLVARMKAAGQEAAGAYFWLQTNGDRRPFVQDLADFMLSESFMFSWAWPGSLIDDDDALARLRVPARLRDRGGRTIALSYLGFSGNDIVADARRVRRLTDEAGSIFSDFFTLVDPELVAPGARKNLAGQKPTDATYLPNLAQALANQSPGAPEAAAEIYRLESAQSR